MSHRANWIAAFDVDGTLAPVNQPPPSSVRRGLGRLRRAGAHLVLASGKPCLYLAGFARALGWAEASLIGENGAEVWLRAIMPSRVLRREIPAEARAALGPIEALLEERFPGAISFHQNPIGVCAFPYDPVATPPPAILEAAGEVPDCLVTYPHVDSVDFAARGIDKGTALLDLARALEVPRERIAAVGDGENDLPMLRAAAYGLRINDPSEGFFEAGIGDALRLVERFGRGLG
jgi:hydroxymethylpyrimidine pyrophosphatase-like HAD family hydrolase